MSAYYCWTYFYLVAVRSRRVKYVDWLMKVRGLLDIRPKGCCLLTTPLGSGSPAPQGAAPCRYPSLPCRHWAEDMTEGHVTLGELGAMQSMDSLEGDSTGFRWLDRLGRMIDEIPIATVMPTVVMGLIVFGMTGLVVFGSPGLTPIMLMLFKITFAVWAVLQGWYLVWGLRVAYRSTNHPQAEEAKVDLDGPSVVVVVAAPDPPSKEPSQEKDNPVLGSDIYR